MLFTASLFFLGKIRMRAGVGEKQRLFCVVLTPNRFSFRLLLFYQGFDGLFRPAGFGPAISAPSRQCSKPAGRTIPIKDERNACRVGKGSFFFFKGVCIPLRKGRQVSCKSL